jgi:NADPH2:quinone reductase
VTQILGAGQIITSASKDDGIRILKEQYKIKDVINHATENVVDRVRELTQGQGVDIAFDATYFPSSYAKSIETVKEGGSWIILNRFVKEGGEEVKHVAQRKAKLIHADVSRYWIGPERAQLKSFVQGSLTQGVKWLEEGKLKPYINQIIKLEEAENALQLIRQGKAGFGKVVVKVISD